MDKFLFDQELDLCQVIPETTHYLQILNYSVSGRWKDVATRQGDNGPGSTNHSRL